MKIEPGDLRQKCRRAVVAVIVSGIVIGSSGVLLQKIQLLFVFLSAICIFVLLHKEESLNEKPASVLLWLITVTTYLASGLLAMTSHRVLCQLLKNTSHFQSTCSQGDIEATLVISMGMFSVWLIAQLLIAIFGRYK